MSLIILLVPIPRLFKDFTEVICNHSDPPLSTMLELISRARSHRSGLKKWYSRYMGPDDSPVDGAGLGDGYFKFLVLFYLCSIYSNRLLTCIHLNGTSDIEDVEEESQRFAKIIVSLCKGPGYSSLQSSVILAQKLPIAEATIETSEEWRQAWRRSSWQGPLFKMPEQTFKHWCSRFGRRTS